MFDLCLYLPLDILGTFGSGTDDECSLGYVIYSKFLGGLRKTLREDCRTYPGLAEALRYYWTSGIISFSFRKDEMSNDYCSSDMHVFYPLGLSKKNVWNFRIGADLKYYAPELSGERVEYYRERMARVGFCSTCLFTFKLISNFIHIKCVILKGCVLHSCHRIQGRNIQIDQ